MPDFEVYVQPFRITQWRDGCVYATQAQPHDWYPESVVTRNRPSWSGIIYTAPHDEFARAHTTIRVIRHGT